MDKPGSVLTVTSAATDGIDVEEMVGRGTGGSAMMGVETGADTSADLVLQLAPGMLLVATPLPDMLR